ncbi:MAG: cytochrome d ubiquinol oxidase subunit II [Polyangiaceae bacterium]|nr:cytochrome d ubiquinol oxidase subunit II [Polyangiaceae bacterium]
MTVPTDLLLGAVMVVSLVLYVVLGGADFGGGVWDLLASGPRKKEQRTLIEKAIGPIWEANHVWLILVVVLLFGAFPKAFSAIATALHIPLTLFLLGVVLRGSAFTFRAYDSREDRKQRRWGLVFSLASLVAPILLGMTVGAIASGQIRVENGMVKSGFFRPWLGVFPLAVGIYALTLFAFLAAVYLAHQADSQALQKDFRTRALASGVSVGVLALITFSLSQSHAPEIAHGLTDHPITWPLHLVTAAFATTTFVLLYQWKFSLARWTAAAQAGMIVIGWTASQYPYLVVPDLTLAGSAGSEKTRTLLLVALAVGSLVLFPSLFVLFRVFRKTDRDGAH